MVEEWKPCVGFEPFYEVSNIGNIRSLAVYSHKYQRILKRPVFKMKKQETTKDGYKRVLLCYYGKHFHCAVHRLVAQAFIPNPKELPCVNHKDENPNNNNVNNLEWCTHEYNSNYGTLPKRISERMTEHHPMRKKVYQFGLGGTFLHEFNSAKEAANYIGYVTADMIGRACRGKAKTAGGYKWSYIKTDFNAR